MVLTGSDLRVLHLHPTRRCNLQCLHCYSTSGPGEREALGTDLATATVASAGRLGYTMLSVSGGEPLLYPGLWDLLREARRAGMLGAVVTNGLGIDDRVAQHLHQYADVVAVSLDGPPERHNRLRNSPRAFTLMQEGLAALRKRAVPFTLLLSVTADSLADVEWAASYAAGQGASALQIHPIEPLGRAARLPHDRAPDETALKTWLVVRRLRAIWGERLRIETDVADLTRYALPSHITDACLRTARTRKLSQLVSPLVVEPNGDVVPLRYGFDRYFAIGNVFSESLEDMADMWVAKWAASFLALTRSALAQAANHPFAFGNPYQIVADAAAEYVRLLPVPATA